MEIPVDMAVLRRRICREILDSCPDYKTLDSLSLPFPFFGDLVGILLHFIESFEPFELGWYESPFLREGFYFFRCQSFEMRGVQIQTVKVQSG